MALGDNIPRLKNVLGRTGERGFRLGILTRPGSQSGTVEQIDAILQDLVCDVSSLTGPHACLHNEHNDIRRDIQALSRNDATLEARLDGIEAKLDRVISFLDSHFEGAV